MSSRLAKGPVADRWARRWGWALITLAVLLVYWPLSTFAYGLVHGDTLDCWVPWRWFIAQALQDGHFPLWNPYAQGGYPIYADLQGPAWYPPSIALGGTIGHTLYTLQALFLGYVIVGGIGMMRLVRLLQRDARIGLVIGLAYALSGFFTAHQMHFYAVISAAWLPWLLAAQLKLMDRPTWRSALEAALFQALLLTGGNHTFTLIGTWLLLALIVGAAWQAWRCGDRPFVYRLVGMEALFAGLSALMACGTFYAWWEVSPYLARTEGMAYADAAMNPFTGHALWSMLFPYAVGTDAAWLGTDPTMANGFTGVIMVLLAAFALVRKRSRVENIIGVFGMVCALASFGAALPVHRLLWAAVPGLDLFRFPSYYQWFAALAVLVLASGTLARWSSMMPERRAWVRAAIGATLALVVAVLAWAWLMHFGEPPFRAEGTLYERITGPWRWHRVLVAAPATLAALAAFLWWARIERPRWGLLALLVLVEMGWATMLAQWNTALGDYSPARLQARLSEQPHGPVWPELVPIGEHADGSALLRDIWRNMGNFTGKPSLDGFNSFRLKDRDRLADEHPALLTAMKRQPLVYLTDSVVPEAAYVPSAVDPARDSALVVVAQPIPGPLHHYPGDSLWVTRFDHDGISLGTSTARPTFALLQQSWYPGWTAQVDGRPVELVRANIACFGVVLPAGRHELSFRFRKPVAPWLLAVSLITFLGGALLLAFVRPASVGALPLQAGALVLAAAVCWSLGTHRPKAERLPQEVQELVRRMDATGAGDRPVVLNTGRFPALAKAFGKQRAIGVRAGEAACWGDVAETLRKTGTGPIWWMNAGLPIAPAVNAGLQLRYRMDTVLWAGRSSATLLRPLADGEEAGTVLFDGSRQGGQWLEPTTPWTSAYRAPADSLARNASGTLVVYAEVSPTGGARPQVALEQRLNGEVVDYESIPLIAGRHRQGRVEGIVARPLPIPRQAGTELGVYVWNNGHDSVLVHRFKVVLLAGEENEK